MVLALLGQSSWQFPVFLYLRLFSRTKPDYKPSSLVRKQKIHFSAFCLARLRTGHRLAVSRTGKPANPKLLHTAGHVHEKGALPGQAVASTRSGEQKRLGQ
jgi:hypothetical protein